MKLKHALRYSLVSVGAATMLAAPPSWAQSVTSPNCAKFYITIDGGERLSFTQNVNCYGMVDSTTGSPKAEDVPLNMLGSTWLYGYTDNQKEAGSDVSWAFDGDIVSNSEVDVTFAISSPAPSLIGLKLGDWAGYWLFTGGFLAGQTVNFLFDNAGFPTNPQGGVTGTGLSHTTLFTTAAIPEPETYALMLAGLGAVAFVARRRKARGN